jgi:hypothetical protein
VGPTPEVIDGLGDKTKARQLGKSASIRCQVPADRRLAMKVGVPVVPGTPGPVASYEDGDVFIKEYGFPGSQHHTHIRPMFIMSKFSYHQGRHGRGRSRHACRA